MNQVLLSNQAKERTDFSSSSRISLAQIFFMSADNYVIFVPSVRYGAGLTAQKEKQKKKKKKKKRKSSIANSITLYRR